MFLPLARVIAPLQLALFPAFSRWQNDHKQIAEVWLRVVRVIGAVFIPAMLGFIVVAPDFVAVILGHKWRSAVPVLQLLAVVALAQGMALIGQRVLAAVDKTKTVFRFAVFNTIAVIAAFALGLQWGVVGVSICYAAVSVPLQTFYIWLTARAVSTSLREVARTLLGVMIASGVMVGDCLALRCFLPRVAPQRARGVPRCRQCSGNAGLRGNLPRGGAGVDRRDPQRPGPAPPRGGPGGADVRSAGRPAVRSSYSERGRGFARESGPIDGLARGRGW